MYQQSVLLIRVFQEPSSRLERQRWRQEGTFFHHRGQAGILCPQGKTSSIVFILVLYIKFEGLKKGVEHILIIYELALRSSCSGHITYYYILHYYIINSCFIIMLRFFVSNIIFASSGDSNCSPWRNMFTDRDPRRD